MQPAFCKHTKNKMSMPGSSAKTNTALLFTNDLNGDRKKEKVIDRENQRLIL